MINGLLSAWMLSVMALQVACHGHSDERESESHDNRRKTISHYEPAGDPEPQQQQPELHGSYTKMDVLMRGAVPQQVNCCISSNNVISCYSTI